MHRKGLGSEGMVAWITTSRKPKLGYSKVYGSTSKDALTEGYIEAKTGSSFRVYVSDHRANKEQLLRAEVYIDGQL